MIWQKWANQLIEALGLKKLPVSVTYTDVVNFEVSARKFRACGAIKKAAEGEFIDLSGNNSICSGGSNYLGIRPLPAEHAKTLREFLIEGEKLFSCPLSIHRSQALSKVKPPFGISEHIVFAPLTKVELKPDIVIFICNALQAARLINLAYFETGIPMECDPTGALCRSVITYPLVTGKLNVSFGDVTARKMEKFSEDELFVTLPYSHLQSASNSIALCTAGTATGKIPDSMRELMKSAGEELEI